MFLRFRIVTDPKARYKTDVLAVFARKFTNDELTEFEDIPVILEWSNDGKQWFDAPFMYTE